MRVIMLAAAVLVGCMLPACAESTPEPGRALPPFEKSRCAGIEDPAGQLFCSDPELQNTGARLNIAVQDRINRIADRRIAVEENVEWIKSRDLSCGIFDRQSVAAADFASVKACLLKET